jgi:hypothetical protein
MTPTGAVTIATLVAAILAPGVLRAQPLLPDIADYAVLGLGGVSIRRETRVLSGAVGAVAGTVRLGRQSRVTNIVAGPTIRLGVSTRTGTLFCHLASGPPPLPLCNAFADPLVNPALLAPVPVTPGATDLIIPPHSSASPYPAGSFGDVRVGVGSVLQLSGGTYTARSLRIARGGRVVCSTDCRIGVLGLVRLRRGAALGSFAPIQANTARVDVAASGPLPAFVARARSNVSATIFAPAGDVALGPLGSYRGAFVGRTVVIGPDATVRGDSAL